MEEAVQRFVQGFMSRLEGPFSFRMIVQPLMAMVFAILDGLKDAKWGKPAYFWALFGNAEHRRELLQSGWKSFGKIFVLGIVLDVVYQLKVQQPLNVGGVIIAALVLAVLPYMVLRGPVNRLARLFGK